MQDPTYLMPVDVEKDEEGKENVRLLYVQNKKGERYQPIFSDTGELVKHYRGKESTEPSDPGAFRSAVALYDQRCAGLCSESGRNQSDFENAAD